MKKRKTTKARAVQSLPAKRLSGRTAKATKGGQNVTNHPGLATGGGQGPVTVSPKP